MKLKNIESVEALKDVMFNGDEKNGFYGDGKNIATIPDIPIKHSFADQIYVRQMNLKKNHIIVGAVHNHLHAWFLLTGKVIINNNGRTISSLFE